MVNFSFLLIYTETVENSKHDLMKTEASYYVAILSKP